MAYCDLDDLKKRISEDNLIQLSDDDDIGVIDTDVIDAAIADADAEIDGYCGRRYALPLSPVPTVIRKFSSDIAIYNLYQRREGPSEDREKAYKNAVRFLESVSKGLVTLGAADPDGTPPANLQPQIDSNTKLFSRDNLDGW